MTDALISVAAILALACSILATLYVIVRNAPSQPQRQHIPLPSRPCFEQMFCTNPKDYRSGTPCKFYCAIRP